MFNYPMTEWKRKMTFVLYFNHGHLAKKKKKKVEISDLPPKASKGKVIAYNICINLPFK